MYLPYSSLTSNPGHLGLHLDIAPGASHGHTPSLNPLLQWGSASVTRSSQLCLPQSDPASFPTPTALFSTPALMLSLYIHPPHCHHSPRTDQGIPLRKPPSVAPTGLKRVTTLPCLDPRPWTTSLLNPICGSRLHQTCPLTCPPAHAMCFPPSFMLSPPPRTPFLRSTTTCFQQAAPHPSRDWAVSLCGVLLPDRGCGHHQAWPLSKV